MSSINFTDYLFTDCKTLDKTFLESTSETIDYNDLYNRVNSLSAKINNEFGTGKQMLLLSENNLFFIVSYLSIIKSGNTAVLVETRISDKDLNDVLDNCSVDCFFIQEKHLSKFKQIDNLITESYVDEVLTISDEFTSNSQENDTAVIIFTSGSTGTKKGVMLSHKNLITNTNSIVEYLKLTVDDKVLVVLPFFYCYGASLLHTHLKVGGGGVLSNSIFLGSILKEIDKYQCTGFSGVPSTYQILINKTRFLEQDFPSIRYFTQAGGKLDNKFITLIADAFPNKSFFVMYGATEATARLSYLPPHLVKEKMGSIGKSIPGVKLDVVDSSGNLVKSNEIGEITAIGDNIMQGYFNDIEGTNEKIRDGRLYTGDLATVDEDGFIYIVGRSNNLIKSAGYRIAPNEIQDLVNSVDGVSSCIVIGIPDDIMGEAVTAVVQFSSSNSNELKNTIITRCSKQLPSYKVPKHVVFVDEFPLNSSNKIDLIRLERIVENILKEADDGSEY